MGLHKCLQEMIELAVAATIKCPYCETFHKGAAQMNGATDEELAEVETRDVGFFSAAFTKTIYVTQDTVP